MERIAGAFTFTCARIFFRGSTHFETSQKTTDMSYFGLLNYRNVSFGRIISAWTYVQFLICCDV